MKSKILIISLLLVILFSACQPPTAATLAVTTAAPGSTATQTPGPTVTPSPVPTATLTPLPTATLLPDLRLPPEQRRSWPVLPQLSNRAREIYAAGLANGNNPQAYSILGGLNRAIPNAETLAAAGPDLQETVLYYSAALKRAGAAQLETLDAPTLFSIERTLSALCAPAETPLECELRLNNPAIVFIHLQAAYPGRTPEGMETLYRQTLDTVIAGGALPVMVFNAESTPADALVNDRAAALAYEYDIPAWNLPAALNQNIDLRLSLLQALNALHTGLRDLQPPWAPAIAPIAAPATNRVIFGVRQRSENDTLEQGIYLFDIAAQTTTQLRGPGFNLQAVSPDRTQLLVSQGEQLFLQNLDGSESRRISDSLVYQGLQAAAWLPDASALLVIARQDGQTAIWQVSLDGTQWTRISPEGVTPFEFYPNRYNHILYWASGSCAALEDCTQDGLWQTDLLSGKSVELGVGLHDPRLSPDGQYLAYRYYNEDGRFDLAIQPFDRSRSWNLSMPGEPIPNFSKPRSHSVDSSWSPDSRLLATLYLERSYYSGTQAFNRLFLANPQTLQTIEPGVVFYSQNARLLWSPDGSQLLVMGTRQKDNGDYYLALRLLDTLQYNETIYDEALNLGGAPMLFTTNLEWIP